jgi:AcrR family transcriptional regulator
VSDPPVSYTVRVGSARGRHGRPPKDPIWARPEPRSRGRRAALSRAQIVRTALAVADAEGLEAVTIRRLAREIGAGAMSLYHYFESRDELLDLMGDTVAGEMLLPSMPEDWRAALKAIAFRCRAVFQAHPWLHGAMQERPLPSPNLLRHSEQSSQAVAALGAQGVDGGLLTAIVLAVDDYLVGFTLREQSDEVPRGDRFEQGLDWLLDGFAAELGR